MPLENPFPLNIEEKQDSWNKLQLLTNVAPEFKITAEEFNKITNGLQWLYENSSGGSSSLAGLSDVRITNPETGHILKFDLVNGEWVNEAAQIGGGAPDGNIDFFFRNNTTENVAPTSSEVTDPQNGDAAEINLDDTIIEKWVYISDAWVKRYKISIENVSVGVQSVVSGSNININDADPANPIISAVLNYGQSPVITREIHTDTVNAMHSPTFLTLPTSDGSGQTVHPCAIPLVNGYNLNGVYWKYAMLVSPYPNSNDDYENPEWLVSNDGINWQVPGGISNPLVPGPSNPDHLSDPAMIEAPDGSKLHCWYRYTDAVNGNERIMYFNIDQTGAVSIPVQILSGDTAQLLSPYVTIVNNKYRLHYVDKVGGINQRYIESDSPESGFVIGDAETITVNNIPSGYQLWHSSFINYYDNIVLGLFCLSETGTNGVGAVLYLGQSLDGGNTFKLSDNVLLNREVSGWLDSLVYFASGFVLNDNELSIYYSGMNSSTLEWRTGNTKVSLFNNNQVVSDEKLLFNYNSLNPNVVYTSDHLIMKGRKELVNNFPPVALSPLNTNSDYTNFTETGTPVNVNLQDDFHSSLWVSNDGKFAATTGTFEDKVFIYKFIKQMDGSTVRYLYRSINVQLEDNQPYSVKFNPSLTRMWLTGIQKDDLNLYDVTLDDDDIPLDAVYVNKVELSSINASINTPVDFDFSPDELNFTILNSFDSTLYDLGFSIAGDILTASAGGSVVVPNLNLNAGRTLGWIKNGTECLIGNATQARQFSVTTAYTTAGFTDTNNVGAIPGVTSLRGMCVFDKGNLLATMDNLSDYMRFYKIATS